MSARCTQPLAVDSGPVGALSLRGLPIGAAAPTRERLAVCLAGPPASDIGARLRNGPIDRASAGLQPVGQALAQAADRSCHERGRSPRLGTLRLSLECVSSQWRFMQLGGPRALREPLIRGSAATRTRTRQEGRRSRWRSATDELHR